MRRVQQNRPGSRRDRGGQGVQIQVEAAFGQQRDPHQTGAGGCHGSRVGHVHRLRHDHLVTGLEQALAGGEEGRLRAGEHHHLRRIDKLARQSLMVGRDGGTQLGLAGHVGVVRPAGIEARLGAIDDRPRRRQVGVAH